MTDPSQSSSPGARTVLTAGVDIGTTAVKAVLVDDNGEVVARSRLASSLEVGPGGLFQHDAAISWWDAPGHALAEVTTTSLAPEAVAVSAMMPSVAAVGADGRPIGPGLLYGDARGADPAPAPGDAFTPVDPLANPEMARLCQWAAADQPEAAGYWPAQAVANAALGGEGVTDLASAFASGPLYNGSTWDEAACRGAGLSPGQLPRVAVFGEPVGHVGATGAVLAAGSVDGLCEQLVSGAVEDGDVVIGLGSTLVVWLIAPGWPDVAEGLWRVPHIVGGKAMVGGASNAGGMWADWARRLLGAPPLVAEGESPWTGLAPANVPVWWPWARGERVPFHDPRLTVTLKGADISQGSTALLRGAYEATGFVTRHLIERASECGTSPKRFIISGGGAANQAWVQALADVLGEPVLPLAVPESAALGAAFLARMALGVEKSMDDAVRWARWSAPVTPAPGWAEQASRRYGTWLADLPPMPVARPPAL